MSASRITSSYPLHPYIPTSSHPYIPTSLHPYIHTSIHPSVVAAATGRFDGVGVIAGMLAGIALFNAAFDRLPIPALYRRAAGWGRLNGSSAARVFAPTSASVNSAGLWLGEKV